MRAGALAFPSIERLHCEPTDYLGGCPHLGRGPGHSYGRAAFAKARDNPNSGCAGTKFTIAAPTIACVISVKKIVLSNSWRTQS